MLQALPVSQWLNGSDRTYALIDMEDDTEKDHKETEKDKTFSLTTINELLITLKVSPIRDFSSENAITLHHEGVNTPPPDYNG